MHSDCDAADDYKALGVKLQHVIDDLTDPEARASGSDAASLARTRRVMADGVSIDRVADLEADYELLGDAMSLASGSGAAAVAQERKMIRRMMAVLAAPTGEAKVEQLDSYRATRTATSGSSRRRRKTG